ncbi:MAG: DUF2341 domain-containing protein [Candidatus Omnitrophota bacterium]
MIIKFKKTIIVQLLGIKSAISLVFASAAKQSQEKAKRLLRTLKRPRNDSLRGFLSQRTELLRKTVFILSILVLSACITASTVFAVPEKAIFKSSLVWRPDDKGDYIFQAVEEGNVYEISEPVKTEGTITSITAAWSFKGEVTLQVSADNGNNYVPVINGVSLTDDFESGNLLKWKVRLGPDSELYEVRISYTDGSGVIGSFGEPELSGFKKRKILTIDNPAEKDLFNYQIKLIVGALAPAEGESVYDTDCQGKVREDYGDIRFTASDGQTLLPYYIDDIIGNYPESHAVFWVKVPHIPAKGINIYFYYNNPLAETISDGNTVFDFFDEFDGEKIDTDKWNVIKGIDSIVETRDSKLILENAELLAKEYKLKDGIIEFKLSFSKNSGSGCIIRNKDSLTRSDSTSQIAYSSAYTGAEHCIAIGDNIKTNDPVPAFINKAYTYRIITKDTDITFKRYSEGFEEEQVVVEYSDTTGLTEGYPGLKTSLTGAGYYEWIRTRKHLKEAPYVISAFQEEDTNLAEFSGVKLAENGDLMVDKDAGTIDSVYAAKTLFSDFETRIIVAKWDPEIEASLDISTDGGLEYTAGRANNTYYYASRGHFDKGQKIKLRVHFKDTLDENQKIQEIFTDYAPGTIMVVEPNGGEIWGKGANQEILWSALEYEDKYEMDIAYSLDNGNNFIPIAQNAKNSGNLIWHIPENLPESNRVMIKVSDADAGHVNDISDKAFEISAISSQQDEDEEEESFEESEKEFADVFTSVTLDENETVYTDKDISFHVLVIGDGTGEKKSKLVLKHNINPYSTKIIIRKGGELIQANNNEQSIMEDLIIEEGGVLTHKENDDEDLYKINFSAKNIIMEKGARITADGKGYAGGGVRKDGKGKAPGRYTDKSASGGSHGGIGGKVGIQPGIDIAKTYYGDQKAPLELGSGGAGSWFSKGGGGGGVIRLHARESFIAKGKITADGEDGGISLGYQFDSAGGAGGSIYLLADKFDSTGVEITASGGYGRISGGGGGGGRVYIYSEQDGRLNGTWNVNGGDGVKRGGGGSFLTN